MGRKICSLAVFALLVLASQSTLRAQGNTATLAGATVDEQHLRLPNVALALQSAVGGMVLSVVGMAFAAFGHLPPVAGAVAQEIIDVLAVANALRVALPPKSLIDY